MRTILIIYLFVFCISLNAESDTIVKIGLPNVPGIMFRSDAGNLVGIPLEVTAQAFEDESILYDWVEGSWFELYNKLERGEIDVLPGMMVTDKRTKIFDLLENDFYMLWSEIYIHIDTDYNKLYDFNGKKIGLVRNDQNAFGFEDYIRDFYIDYEEVWFDSHTEAINALKNKEIYGFAGPNPNILDAILQKDLKRSGLYFNPSKLTIAFAKGRFPKIKEKIDKRIEVYKNDPNSILNELINDYRVSHISPNEPFIPNWLFYTLAITFSAAIISLLFIVMLRKTVKEKTTDLILAKQKAEESERLKSEFLANMSHEIRTPLNSIVGFSNIMSEPDIDKDEMKYFSDIIAGQSEMLLTLINDIVDYAKIESNSLKFRFTSNVSIIKLLNEVYDNFKLVNHENIYFNKQFCFEDTVLETDRLRLQQIINNFLSNSFKHTHSGTVTLGYEKMGSSKIRIYVRDEGEGISKDAQNTIFDRFYKSDNFTQGAGLGLPISKAIADHLGYEIGVESDLGEGSNFYVIIDLTKK